MKNQPGNNQTASAILQMAIDGLEATENEHVPLDDFLDEAFLEDASLRGPVTNLLFTYYRRKGLVDHLINKLAAKVKPRHRRLLAIAITQMRFNTGIVLESAANVAVDMARQLFGKQTAGFVNAVLRRSGEADLDAVRAELKPYERANVCPELLRQWQRQFDAETIMEFTAAAQQQPLPTFRLRRDISEADLGAIEAKALSLPEWAGKQRFYHLSSLRPLLDSGWLECGMAYVQDPVASMAPEMAEITPDMMVLDLCAAPGGKSLILAEKLSPRRLVACDRSARRHALTQENFQNGGLEQYLLVADALYPPFAPESFDVVLLDVPCSNTGVGRQRPDAWWNFSDAKLRELSGLQQKIMLQGAALVKKGGQLIYSTCSIEKQEDRQQVDKFLKSVTDFYLDQERLLLPGADHDGAYAARLRRRQ